jgi:hypothetical protein
MSALIYLPGNSTTNDLIMALKQIEALVISLRERIDILEKNKKHKA